MARYGSAPLLDQPYAAVAPADVEGVRHQVRDGEPARGEQVEHRLEVAPLGPAHLPGRVVDAPRLVGRVVPAGAVGAGEPQGQLALVERGPV